MTEFMNIGRDHVRNIQRAINEITYRDPGFKALAADGLFGNESRRMLRIAQRINGLPETGTYTGQIVPIIEALIAKRFLTDQDVRELAAEYDIEYAVLAAIIDVESRGTGFLTNTRATILFERHKFYQEVKKAFGQADADRLFKLHPDICNPKPGGYTKNEWARLEKAMLLSQHNAEYVPPAIRATSWGMGQVMGFHAEYLGYTDTYEFFHAVMRSERNQVEAMIRYLMADPNLKRAVDRKDWATIARLYNGSNYAINRYDVKLADAYKKFST